jgi:hypothetical protein
VVTPPGEIPTSPGDGAAADAEDELGDVEDGVDFSFDEHPASTAAVAITATASPRNKRVAVMCATLFVVMGHIGTRECCQA